MGYEQVSLFTWHKNRRGMLDNNLAFAVRHVCTRPETVIITLDADDCLIAADALAHIHATHFLVKVLAQVQCFIFKQ